MKTRNAVRLISFCAAAVLVAAVFAVRSGQDLKRYRLEIQNNYSRSLDGLNASVNNISLILEKAEYVTTAKQLSRMSAQLLSEAENAKSALAQLPAGDNLDIINRFLSQVGNYAVSVSEGLIGGESLNEEYTANISALKNTAQKISEAVGNSSIAYDNPSAWADNLDNKLEEAVDKDSLNSALDTLEDSLSDYPTLVYDGPYSDHILEKEPLMLKDAENVTEGEALKKAAETAECEVSALSSDGTVDGKIPAYRFSGGNISVTVSRAGGYAVYMRKSREIGDYVLQHEQAVEKAKRYLERIGMSGFTETYYFTDEGVCVINFAYLDGKTVCYTDLVKVGVAMDTGEIMLYEASGYLTNHTERAFESAAVSAEEAAKTVSPKLKIREMALALIPTKGGNEKRCYEFVCTAEDGREILVYINAVTNEEEDILILLKSDGGTLTK
ncbi:MAG: PepSY1/2 domain-containing protein [Acutalibacteraceae bacterium]